MEEKLTNEVEKLYLIRGLMSMISQNSNKLNSIEEKLEEVERQSFESKEQKKYESGLNSKKENEKRLKSELSEVEKVESEFNTRIRYAERAFSSEPYPGYLSSYKEYLKFYGWGRSMAVFFLVFVLTAALSASLFIWWANANFSFWIGALAFTVAIISLIVDFIIYLPIGSRPSIEDFEWRKEKERVALEELRAQSLENTAKKEQLIKELTDLKKTCSKEEAQSLIDAEYNQFLQERKKLWEKATQEKNALVKESAAMYAYVKRISPVHESDWENIDVIIYEIESGRASSLKEALQQTDLYIRHSEIIAQFKVATNAICHAITTSMDSLSLSIGTQLKAIKAEFSELSENQRIMTEELSSLIEAQKVSNALLEKANESSKDLAKDVKRIKNVQEYDFYNLVY